MIMMSLEKLKFIASGLKLSEAMPLIFVGHGSPMNAIEENEFVTGFREVAASIPTPQTILCISAHYYTRGTRITVNEMPRTIHDFYGFPPELYDINYPAPGNPGLAKDLHKHLTPRMAELDEKWGLDHGAWSVLRHMFPDADIPVVQLSIDYTRDVAWHANLARELAALRWQGVLIIGSGNIVHNLRLVDFRNFERDNYGFEWAREAHALLNSLIEKGDIESLIRYRDLGKAVGLAVPTPDHYLPLIYIMALRENREYPELFNDKFVGGSLTMTSLRIG